jgi:hypothetical protein
MAMGRPPITLESERRLALPAQVVWERLANTEDLNREIGLPTVSYGPVTVSAEAFYRHASTRLWGLLAARWREYPFEWVRGERYSVLRTFESGFLDTFYGGVRLRAEGAATVVRFFAELVPRGLLGGLAARVMGRRGIRQSVRYCEAFAASRRAGETTNPVPSRYTRADPQGIEALTRELGEVSQDGGLVQRFIRHLAAAPDHEVLRMQPLALARGWGAERDETIRLFLDAERLGALLHTWEILCPNCRVPKGAARSVGGVPPRFHCDLCAIDYAADLARNVELRFSVHPRLRPAQEQVYCLGGPASFPHIWAQLYMLPGTERVFSLMLPGEAFRARSLRQNQLCPLEPDAGAPGEAVLTYRRDGWYQMRQRFRPGPVSIRLQNETDGVMVLVIEQVRWDPCAITAAEAMANPLFQTIEQAQDLERSPAAGAHAAR